MISSRMYKICFVFSLLTSVVFGQSAEHYFERIFVPYQEITIEVWEYTKYAKNSQDLNSQEDKRLAVLKKLENQIGIINQLGGWQNDLKLFSAVRYYYKVASTALKLSYSELETLEMNKNNSVEKMIAFQKKEKEIRKSLLSANQEAIKAIDEFSVNYKIDEKADHSDMIERMRVSGDVYNYYDAIYILIFECNLHEEELMKAIEKKDVNRMAEISQALELSANKGIGALNQIRPYLDKDDRLRKPTRQLLDFYKIEAKNHVAKQISFFEAQVHFEEHIARMKANPKRTKEDVDNFKKEEMELRKKTELFNRENEQINARRSYVVNVWNNDAVNFIEINGPK